MTQSIAITVAPPAHAFGDYSTIVEVESKNGFAGSVDMIYDANTGTSVTPPGAVEPGYETITLKVDQVLRRPVQFSVPAGLGGTFTATGTPDSGTGDFKSQPYNP